MNARLPALAMREGILVTGGAGFIGHHLVRALAQNPGYNVVIVDNLSSEKSKQRAGGIAGATFYNTDIRNKSAISSIIRQEKIRSCVHLAARISVKESIANPYDTIDVNVNGTLAVLAACAEENVNRFVFASSAAVYGEAKTLPIVEDQELNPISPYGVSKVSGEWLVNAFRNAGRIPNAMSLRFFNVYGAGQSPEYAGVITKFAERLDKGLIPVIFGTGEQTRDFVSVADIVRAIQLTLERNASGTCNIGTGRPTSINDLARIMLSIYGSESPPEHHQKVDGDIVDSCADISMARRTLGFEPTADLYHGLQRLIRPEAAGIVLSAES